MKIINLVENTAGPSGCGAEHGLSFYIETARHKILMDTGASELFFENAQRLGVDLKAVDLVVLSHGHYDHSGGLVTFRSVNANAPIFLQTAAAGDYYSVREGEEPRYIGISENAKALQGLIFVPPVGELRIDSELSLFAGIGLSRPISSANGDLKEKTADGYADDSFGHEQCLVVREGRKSVLFSGCAHHGILNILDRYRELFGEDPTHVVSGFHMKKDSGYTEEDTQFIIDTALELTKYRTMFYTGHCTGEVPFEAMKKIMEEQLEYVHSGDEVILRDPPPAKSRNDHAGNRSASEKKKGNTYMKWHKFFAWATVTSFFLTMITGYKRR